MAHVPKNRGTYMRHGEKGKIKIGHRYPRCTSHVDKAASRQMIRSMGLEAAKKGGWVK